MNPHLKWGTLIIDFLLLLTGILFLIFTFTLDLQVPLFVEGNLISAQNCYETCPTLSNQCNYWATVNVSFELNSTLYIQTFTLDGSNTICLRDCCQEYIHHPIYITYMLNSYGYPLAYDIEVSPPGSVSSHQTVFFAISIICIIVSLCMSAILARIQCREKQGKVYEPID